MSTRLIIEGNAVYEIDEDCQACGKSHIQTPVRTEACEPENKSEEKQKEEEQ